MTNPINLEAAVQVQPASILTVPEAPDPEQVILNLAQLKAAILEASGLTEEDLEAFKMDTKFTFMGTDFEIGQLFPGTESKPKAEQLFVLQMFHGDHHDKVEDHIAGDVRLYVCPVAPTNPKARDWRLFTFSRQHPSMRVERMTQATFITEIGEEWGDLDELLNGDDDEPDPAAPEATS